MTLSVTWTGILGFEGVDTNESAEKSRFIRPDALSWDLPKPLRITMKDKGSHADAEVVGSIDEAWRDPDDPRVIRGAGRFDANSPIGLEAARLAHEGYKTGISMDPGNATRSLRIIDGSGNELDPSDFTDASELPPDARVQEVVEEARLRAATIVDIPAFEGARIETVTVEGADDSSDPFALTAAAMDHDGAMVALVPTPDDAERLAVEGYEPAEILHLTLYFLGDAEEFDPDTRDRIETAVADAISSGLSEDPIEARAWAAAHFNPDGVEHDPAVTYLVGGQELTDIRSGIVSVMDEVGEGDRVQHTPWVPHVTIGYGDLSPDALDQFGEVTFDRIRVAFGPDDVRDIELSGGTDEPEEDADEPESENTVVAAAVPSHSTPAVDSDVDWDGNAAELALPTGESPEFYRRFYAYQSNESDHDGTAKDHWHYIHHFVEGEGPDAAVGAASGEACHAIIGLLNGARGVTPVARGEDRKTVYDHCARHMRDAGMEPPELKADPTNTATAASAAPGAIHMEDDPMATATDTETTPSCEDFLSSLTASAAVDLPTVPADHFSPIDFSAPTPLTLDPETGHVYGHVAQDKVCHVGLPNCVTMPRSSSGLRYFHTGLVRLDDGTDVATGRITMKGPHADVKAPWRSAMAHYDDVTTAIADVVAWEDEHGIAVSGHVRPGTDPSLVHAFRASTPSGDWREIGGRPEIINIHMVNSPGFPVYRTEGDRIVTTIAASAAPARLATDPDPSSFSPAATLSALTSDGFSDEVAQKVVTILERNHTADALAADVAPHRDRVAEHLARGAGL